MLIILMFCFCNYVCYRELIDDLTIIITTHTWLPKLTDSAFLTILQFYLFYRHDGLSALESFLYQISQHFLEAPESDETTCKSILMYFVKQFRTIMHDLTSSSKKVGISVRGYGYFASACNHFLKPKEVETLVNEIVRRSDKMLVIHNDDRASERVYQLPSFLEAFASIAKELGCVNQSFGTCLEQLIIMLFEFFPRIIPKHQKPAFTSLSRALLSLISSQSVLKKLLHNIIYQVRTPAVGIS